jgi:cytochrome P450
MTGTPPGSDIDVSAGRGGAARTSLLDSWGGRWRARLQLAVGRLAVRGFSLMGDPFATVVRGRPGTDPYGVYEQVRRQGQLAPSRLGVRTVTSRDLCDEVLRDPRFGVETPAGMSDLPGPPDLNGGGPLAGSFVELDPPQHTRLRRLTAPAFRPKLIRHFTPAVEAALAEVLEPLAGRDSFDLMTEVASPFPIAVISRLLGIPAADTSEFRRMGVLVGQSLDGVRTVRQAQQLRQAGRELEILFRRLAEQRRTDPRDDVISLLAAAEADGRLVARDLVATCGLLLVAGFETTVNLVGNGVAALQRDRAQWTRLVEDPSRAEAVVEETLRFDPPVQITIRIAQENLKLHGTWVGRGTVIALLLAAANRDPAAYAQPDRFDPDRSGEPEHLAFSSGIHYCLGAPLARLEGAIAFRTLAERWPDLTVLPGARRRLGTTIRGFATLPVQTGRVPANRR